MTSTSAFSMWGERGLIATFFADLHQLGNPEAISKFMQIVEFPDASGIASALPTSVHYIIEPDFANTGFGHPDAVIAAEYGDGTPRAVLIVEAKRTDFARACAPRSQRGQKGFNSTLNGQLELDYCLAMALSEYRGEDEAELVEPKWVLSSPYGTERRGTLRRLKNRAVLEDVVSLICGAPLDRYYFLVITNDDRNPFPHASEEYLPELFRAELDGLRISFANSWPEVKSRFGWTSYAKMQTLVEDVQGELPLSSLFLQSLSINERNMVMGQPESDEAEATDQDEHDLLRVTARKSQLRKSSGKSLIYAPKINSQTFLHFSWKNGSTALRDYSGNDRIPPFEDRTYRTSEVECLIEREISVRRAPNIKGTGVEFTP